MRFFNQQLWFVFWLFIPFCLTTFILRRRHKQRVTESIEKTNDFYTKCYSRHSIILTLLYKLTFLCVLFFSISFLLACVRMNACDAILSWSFSFQTSIFCLYCYFWYDSSLILLWMHSKSVRYSSFVMQYFLHSFSLPRSLAWSFWCSTLLFLLL